jgi:hypothetical protein
MHSGHLKLTVKLLHSAPDCEITLCLMKQLSRELGVLTDDSKSQNMAASLLQKPDMGDHNQALAYIVSIEK